ncbi:MAG: RHS repeat protein, partial [bacterium]|nr:RHS repeat protein [bacterium]
MGRTITRTYDRVGNLTGLIYPNGQAVGYEYDGNGWLESVTGPHGSTSTFDRNGLGQVIHIQHPNNTVVDFGYDDAGRLTRIDHRQASAPQPQSAFAFTMDPVGNRIQVVETRAAFDGSDATVVIPHIYEYDPLNRLVRAATDAPLSDTAYNFDAVGNRLGKTGTALAPDDAVPELPVAPRPDPIGYTYNEANQLTAIDSPQSTTSLAYNDNGDRVQETETLTNGITLVTTYAYDREDRLTGVTKTTSDSARITITLVATYTYDGYGRRAIKQVLENPSRPTQHATRITYLYDGLDITGAQLEHNGVTTETHYYLAASPVTGMRRPYAMERLPNPATGFAGDRYWYQTDGLDSVAALTDEVGDVASPYLYDEYGRMLAGTT